MKIPEALKIGVYTYVVKEVDNLIFDRDLMGEHRPRQQEIVIDRSLSDIEKEDVLLHEILEAIEALYRMGLTHAQINLLGVTLHQVLRDNRLVFYDR